MNIVQVIGNLGKEPETRYTPSGQKVATLTVASNTKKGGKEETTWWRITIWGDRFDKIFPYLKKGSLILVIGEMQKPEIYTNKEGQPQVSLELTAESIKFLPSRTPEKQNGEVSPQAQQQAVGSTAPFSMGGLSFTHGQAASFREESEEESDLPF